VVEKSYIIWFWDSFERNFRLGKIFKDKVQAEKFANQLPHWQYISTTFSYKTFNFAA